LYIKFRRQLVGRFVLQYWDLLGIIANSHFSSAEDKRLWKWEADGEFSNKSYYRFLNIGGIVVNYSSLWKLKIPL